MPTVMRSGPYRFFFWSNERDEPAHVHVEAAGAYAKVWLSPVGVAHALGYTPRETGRILELVRRHQVQLLEAWREFHDRR